MCKQLKKLKNLNVSESRLSFPENEEDMVSGSDFLKKKFSCSLTEQFCKTSIPG
jgi:hypothetical protein